jgi:glucose/arabinose dehydrogenase
MTCRREHARARSVESFLRYRSEVAGGTRNDGHFHSYNLWAECLPGDWMASETGNDRMARAGQACSRYRMHGSRSWRVSWLGIAAAGRFTILLLVIGLALLASGCYWLHPNAGGAETVFHSPRRIDPASIALPAGYRIELIAQGLTFPTGVAFDGNNRVYVVESGYSYGEVWSVPRLLRIEADGHTTLVASGGRNGPWNGVIYDQGAFYVAEGGELEGGRILRILPSGQVAVLVQNLPSRGDHHTDGPVVGPDGWIYFGQGTASNSGVVGEDNFKFGWLKRSPEVRDIPGQDITLTGQNFSSKDYVHPGAKSMAVTGAFSRFGMPTTTGQVIRGEVPCNGAVMRVRREGGPVELVAWGLRNPFGLAFAPDGQLYATDNGCDDRGSRPIWASPDVLWAVRKGFWYGWPDFAAGMAITNDVFRPPWNPHPEFLLTSHPNLPPRPAALFGVHAAVTGLDFSKNARFGHVGEAFVAQFGDQTPLTGKVLHPAGFKVVRVDVRTGVVQDFAVNRGTENGPASKEGGEGFERPIAVRFDNTGEDLYVVDFGVLIQSKRRTTPFERTGVLWRISPIEK